MNAGIDFNSLLVELDSALDVSLLMLSAGVLKECDPFLVGAMAGIGAVNWILLP